MKVAKILQDSVVDGEGLRTVIFFQGCSINCAGCHNPDSHNKRKGRNYNPQTLLDALIEKGFNKKITLSGGEPLEQNNEQLLEFLELFKAECRKRKVRPNIWIYSGRKWEYEDIVADPIRAKIFKICNYLVDGPFVLSKKSELIFRGSTNQRIIDLRRTFGAKKTVVDRKLQYPEIFDRV